MRVQGHFERLKKEYPGNRLLIVSNRAGTDSYVEEAELVEQSTGVPVLRHSTKKPGCGSDILGFFRSHPETGVTRPSQIAVVGDRLLTDIMLANLMGAMGVWVQEGVEVQRGFVSQVLQETSSPLCWLGKMELTKGAVRPLGEESSGSLCCSGSPPSGPSGSIEHVAIFMGNL